MNRKVRKEIIKLIAAGIEYGISKEGELSPENSPKLAAALNQNASTMMDEYDKSVRPGFWYGVWQGVTGNLIWLIILAGFAVLLAVCSLNIWDLMIDSIAAKLKSMP